MSTSLSSRNIALLSAAVCIAAGFLFLGSTGGFVIFGIILLFVLPQYGILKAVKIEEDERWFFSLFIGIAFFPTVVWAVGRVMPLKYAVAFTLMAALALFFVLRTSRRGKVRPQPRQEEPTQPNT